MSVREEERRKNSCSSRGLGLAAAAIGVGVGAALYYFFSKRPENPDTEGSTSEDWSCEQQQSLNITCSPKSEYTTISEHTTTDTSIWVTDNNHNSSTCQKKELIRIKNCLKQKSKNKDYSSDSSRTYNSIMDSSYEDYDDTSCGSCESEYTVIDSESSSQFDDSSLETSQSSHSEEDDAMEEEEESQTADSEHDLSMETTYITLRTSSLHSNNGTQGTISDSDTEVEWDVTNSSTDVPQRASSLHSNNGTQGTISDCDTEVEWDVTNSSTDVPQRASSLHSNNGTQGTISDSESEVEWEVTNSVADVPHYNPSIRSYRYFFHNSISPRYIPRFENITPVENEEEQIRREQAFRERRWSLEECSICFEVMLKDQPLMQLPCTHNFHVACIGPWLQEQQTCPMCRKAAE